MSEKMAGLAIMMMLKINRKKDGGKPWVNKKKRWLGTLF